MPVRPKSKSSLNRQKKSIKTEEKVNMGKIQTAVCRDILDTADVTKSQVVNQVIENFSGKVNREELKESITMINNLIDQQANSLVDRVIKSIK